MTTMISDLPMDLIKEIISRLPMKSVKSARLTCKSWNDLSKSEIGKVTRPTKEGETMMIAVKRRKVYLMSGFFDGVDPSIEQRGRLRFHYHVNIYKVYHYEGLLLCMMKDVTRIVVWNPYLGQTRWIKLRYAYFPQSADVSNYSLGYEDKELYRHFKVLRFVDFFHRAPEEQFLLYEIYDFDTGLWTTLDVVPHWRIDCSSSSVSLKGNSYWSASERSCSKGGKYHIICFDFTRERFGPLLPLPSCVRERDYKYVILSCVKEEKIAALFPHQYAYEFEIWITTTIEAKMVSWSKFLRIDTKVWINIPDCFFIDEEKKVFVCANSDYETYIDIIGEAGYFKKLDSGLPVGRWPRVNFYVPSLVLIKKLSRADKRIEQSSIEKRRFDQKMLRLAEIEKLMKTNICWRRHGGRTTGRLHQYFRLLTIS